MDDQTKPTRAADDFDAIHKRMSEIAEETDPKPGGAVVGAVSIGVAAPRIIGVDLAGGPDGTVITSIEVEPSPSPTKLPKFHGSITLTGPLAETHTIEDGWIVPKNPPDDHKPTIVLPTIVLTAD